MADFRRWILALAVVALLAGLSVPAGAQPIVCNTSVTVTPVVRAEGLSELVGDLVLYCTGGTPTTPGKPVPQVNFTVFLNTNITSKVLGTQLVAFGNGQTSALDEALLIIDEPNSPNSPGVQCGPNGSFNGSFLGTNICLGGVSNGVPYPILNCGAVVGGVPAAPDGGPSGPGVCEIIAPNAGTTADPIAAPEHTYDGTVAGGFLLNSGNQYPDLCGVSLQNNGNPTVVNAFGTLVNGSNVIGAILPATTGILVGATVTDTTTPGNIPANALVTAVSANSVTISSAATVGGTGLAQNDALVFTTSITVNSTQNGDITSGNTIVVNLTTGTTGLAVGESVSGTGIQAGTTIAAINSANVITLSAPATSTKAGDKLTFGVTTVQTQAGSVGAPGYSCGRPNVFQGRIGALQNPNQYNAVTFLGVPFDPPGTGIGRTIRITNIRANAAQLGVSSTFTTQQILMNVAINGPTALTIANPQQIVAYVNKGLSSVAIAPANNQNYSNVSAVGESAVPSGLLGGGTLRSGVAPNVPVIGEFVQCISQDPDLFSATPAPNFLIPGYLGASPLTGSLSSPLAGGYDCPSGGDCLPPSADVTPWVRFSEGFATSWKEKNISFTVGDGTGTTAGAGNANYNTTTLGFACASAYCYNGKRDYPLDVPQNVPGAIYNTETGFSFPPVTSGLYAAPPNPNPPVGFQFNSSLLNSSVPNNGNPFSDDWAGSANATGIAGAGIANQGTRLYLSFGNIPNGASLWVSPVIYLFRQGVQHNGDPATLNTNPINGIAQSQATGVMVLTTTDGSGAGAFSRTATTNPFQLTKVGSTGLVVYEILYTDPYSVEYADVPVVLAYASNPGQNLPAPAPPNPNTNVTGGFAPFYTSAASTQPSPNGTFQSPTLPVPRFVPGTAFDFINVQKCACNVLFPFVANALGYDTGIALANTSLDPGGTFGFLGVPQPGTVQFWYYGDMQGGAAVPGPQTSTAVQPGHVLTYVLSTGSTQYGLDGRGAGLTGYIIAQAQFQYCHAYAFISAQGAGPTSPGTSEGYLGIILDRDGLPRTISIGENKAH